MKDKVGINPEIQATSEIPGAYLTEIIRLYDEGFCGCEPYWENSPEKSVKNEISEIAIDSNKRFVYAENGPQLLAFLIATSMNNFRLSSFALEPEKTLELTNNMYILELAVDKKSRREGLGEKLVGSLIQYAWLTGTSGITLKADLRNTPAIRLYEKMGFELTSESQGLNPFELLIRIDLSKNSAQRDNTGIKTVSSEKLFSGFPLSEYLFFTNPEEISGWQVTTKNSNKPQQLFFSNNLWQKAKPNRVEKSIWLVPRE